MTGAEKLKIIEERIRNALAPENLEVLDESAQHVGHAGYQGGGRHFAVVITASSLKSLSRVDAHRKIYALFPDLIPNEIHALRIVIL